MTVSPAKTAEPIKMPFGLRSQVDPGNHVLGAGPGPPMGREIILGGGKMGRPIVKYRDTLWSSVQKRQNRSRCRLGCGLGCAEGSTNSIVFAFAR